MKTYCKPAQINICDPECISKDVHLAFAGQKLGKMDFVRLLAAGSNLTEDEIAADYANSDLTRISGAIDELCAVMANDIATGDLHLQPIRQFRRKDGLTGKVRTLSKESARQQVYEYIAVGALMPLFKAKFLPCQHGSVPGRGQERGKRQIERILRQKHKGVPCAIKCDIRHAYQSVTVSCVMRLLRRDIGKNKPLLRFLQALMSNYPGGVLVIGGYLSTWLFNYVMSYFLRKLTACGQVRRGKRKRFVIACVCYADDFAVFGHMSQLIRGIKSTARWAAQALGLHVKQAWAITIFEDFKTERARKGKRGTRGRCHGLDMMGFVITPTHTAIRGRIFKRIRRQFIRAARDLETLHYIPWWRAQRIVSYYGWIVGSDSRRFRQKYGVDAIMRATRKSAGQFAARLSREAVQCSI